MRTGVRIALDLGSVRIGVARCDSTGTLASPHDVWQVAEPEVLIEQLKSLINEYEPIEIVVGLPTDMRGEQGIAAQNVREQARGLQIHFPQITWRLVDERLTTAAARKQLAASGYTTRTDRKLIDAASAVILLEDTLEAERRQGVAPGEVVE
jgi:putative Holliday junction resolvase